MPLPNLHGERKEVSEAYHSGRNGRPFRVDGVNLDFGIPYALQPLLLAIACRQALQAYIVNESLINRGLHIGSHTNPDP